MTQILDTHAIVKDIIASGIKEKSAEQIVKAIVDTKIYDMSEIATKVDLEKIQRDIANVKANLLKWYIGTTLTGVTVLATIATIYFM